MRKLKFNVQLNLPHLVYIYRGNFLIGNINCEYDELTLLESVTFDEVVIINEKIKELQDGKSNKVSS